MTKDRDYADAGILALRHRYREVQAAQLPAGREIFIGTDSVPLRRESLFGGMCSIMLPQSMTDMDDMERLVRYPDRNRPPVIRTDADREASVTFSLLPPEDDRSEEHTSELQSQR